MTDEDAIKLSQVLTTDERVYGLEIDSLLRQCGNQMTAMALFRALDRIDFASPDFAEQLWQLILESSQGDPSVLIGFDDGRWQHLPESIDEPTDENRPGDCSCHCWLRVRYITEEASFYLFHSAGRLLEAGGVVSSGRKRAGAFHYLCLELADRRFLQPILMRLRECPHVIRAEESSEADFLSAPSHSPGY
jgi:hypothetical protein